MSEENENVTNNFKEKVEFEYSLKQRNFEIDLFWKRSWFFGALILAEVAAFYKLKTDNNFLFPSVTICFITCLTSLAQCLMNRGSKYWQERWEYMTMNRETALNIELTKLKKFKNENIEKWFTDKFQESNRNEWFFIDASILSKNDNALTISRRFSVSKITFLVWDIIFICSLLCWLNESYLLISSQPDRSFTIKLSLFYIIIIAYIIFFWFKGNVFEPYKKEMTKMDIKTLEDYNNMYIDNIINPDKFK